MAPSGITLEPDTSFYAIDSEKYNLKKKKKLVTFRPLQLNRRVLGSRYYKLAQSWAMTVQDAQRGQRLNSITNSGSKVHKECWLIASQLGIAPVQSTQHYDPQSEGSTNNVTKAARLSKEAVKKALPENCHRHLPELAHKAIGSIVLYRTTLEARAVLNWTQLKPNQYKGHLWHRGSRESLHLCDCQHRAL